MTPDDTPTYPEHERLAEIREQSQACGEFVDWLRDSEGIILASWWEEPYLVARVEVRRYGGPDRWSRPAWVSLDEVERNPTRHRFVDLDGARVDEPVTETRHREARLSSMVPPLVDLLARHFNIDQRALEAEKTAMLDTLREAQKRRA